MHGQPSSETRCLDSDPYVIPSPYFVCAGSNGSEKIARLCRLNLALAALLYACSTTCTCTMLLVSIISFMPSHVTYHTRGKSSFKHECAATQWGHGRPLKFSPFTYFCVSKQHLVRLPTFVFQSSKCSE